MVAVTLLTRLLLTKGGWPGKPTQALGQCGLGKPRSDDFVGFDQFAGRYLCGDPELAVRQTLGAVENDIAAKRDL